MNCWYDWNKIIENCKDMHHKVSERSRFQVTSINIVYSYIVTLVLVCLNQNGSFVVIRESQPFDFEATLE
jgi:hypothetical protein